MINCIIAPKIIRYIYMNSMRNKSIMAGLTLLLSMAMIMAWPVDARSSGYQPGAYAPSSVYDPGANRHLLVYTEINEYLAADIYGVFAGPDASPDAPPFRISDEGAAVPSASRAAVALDPTSGIFLVLWSEIRAGAQEIRAALINSTGHAVGPGYTVSAPAGTALAPAVAFSPEADSFIMAWQDYGADDYDIQMRQATIVNSAHGQSLLLGEIKQAYAAPGDQSLPELACHHDSLEDKVYCLLVFEDYAYSADSPAISGQVIDLDQGSTIMPLYNGLDISGHYGGYEPSVAATQRQELPFWVAWSGPEGRIRARYMDTTGLSVPPFNNVFEPYGQAGIAEGVRAAFDPGTGRSALFWQDLYNGQRDIYASFLEPGQTSGEIYHLSQVTAGQLTDEMNLAVSYNSLMPSFLVSYETSDWLSTFNIRMTTITDPAYPEITVTDPSYPYEDLAIEYPPVVFNSTVSHTISVYNDSPLADLTIRKITVDGPFAVAGQNCTLDPLAPSSDPCMVTVEFSPDMSGAAIGILNITSDDPNEPLTSLFLSGAGLAPSIEVTDTSQPPDDLMLDFGKVAVGSTSEGTITVRNGGDHILSLGRVGGYSRQFLISSDNCSGLILTPSEYCTVVVKVTPTREGAHGGSLWISSDDPSMPQLQFRLQAQGVMPHIGLMIPEGGLRFGSVKAGALATSGVVLTNPGGSPLRVYAISSQGEAFAIVSDPCTGKEIPPGGSCTLDVSFSPAGTLNYTGSLSIKSNDPETLEAIIALSGSGALPIASVHMQGQGGEAADFGAVGVGLSAERTLRITNIGLAPLVLGDYTLNGTAFSISSDQCSGRVLSYAVSCAMTLRFSPDDPVIANYQAHLSMTTNESGKDGISVSLQGALAGSL